jgi:hypothetical protein
MSPGVRRFARTAHIIASVGWLGAVLTYLVIAVLGVTGAEEDLGRAAYLLMDALAWTVLVPLSVASLVTGLISALGTSWGLLRHYWVLFKLVLNLAATTVLLLYTQSIGYFAELAARGPATGAELKVLGNPTHIVHAGAALVVLTVATVLAVYKPQGLTRYGQRRRAATAR